MSRRLAVLASLLVALTARAQRPELVNVLKWKGTISGVGRMTEKDLPLLPPGLTVEHTASFSATVEVERVDVLLRRVADEAGELERAEGDGRGHAALLIGIHRRAVASHSTSRSSDTRDPRSHRTRAIGSEIGRAIGTGPGMGIADRRRAIACFRVVAWRAGAMLSPPYARCWDPWERAPHSPR